MILTLSMEINCESMASPDIVEAIRVVPHKGIQVHPVQQTGVFPAPQILEDVPQRAFRIASWRRMVCSPCRKSWRTLWRRYSLRSRGYSGSHRGEGWCVPHDTDPGGRCGGDTACVPEGVQDRFVDKDGVFPVPQIMEDAVEAIQLASQRAFGIAWWRRIVCSPCCVVEILEDSSGRGVIPVSQILENVVEAIQLAPQRAFWIASWKKMVLSPCRRSCRTLWRRYSLCLEGLSKTASWVRMLCSPCRRSYKKSRA